MYFSASRLLTVRTSALFEKPRPVLSGGKVDVTFEVSTLRRSWTVRAYSARFRRRRGVRPGLAFVMSVQTGTGIVEPTPAVPRPLLPPLAPAVPVAVPVPPAGPMSPLHPPSPRPRAMAPAAKQTAAPRFLKRSIILGFSMTPSDRHWG